MCKQPYTLHRRLTPYHTLYPFPPLLPLRLYRSRHSLLAFPQMDRKSRASRSTSADDSAEITLWRRIYGELVTLDDIQKKGDGVIQGIDRIHSAIEGNRVSAAVSSRLQGLYRDGMEFTEKENSTIASIQESLQILIAIRTTPENTTDLKRKKRKTDVDDTLLRSPIVKKTSIA